MQIRSVAVVGLGPTGLAVARRLVELGFDVAAYDRDAGRVAEAAAAGVRPARLPADAAEGADVVFVRMPDEDAVAEVLFHCGGVGDTLADGRPVVDASGTGPAFARAVARRLGALGLVTVETCLLGDATDALTGRMRIFAGGAAEHVSAVTPVLAAIADDITHAGPVGTAAARAVSAKRRAPMADQCR
jgi:3-hydroxyisobutyrate dehydrogenase